LTVAVRVPEESFSLQSAKVDFDVIQSFIEYLDLASDVLLRVCMHETNANASAVYFDGFHSSTAVGAQHTDESALFCVEETNVLRILKHNSIRCDLQPVRHRGRHMVAFCQFHFENIEVPVLKLDELSEDLTASSLVSLHIGRVYKLTHSFSVQRHHDGSDDWPHELVHGLSFRWTDAADCMIRNRKHFVYIVQNDVFCSASHLRHKDAEVLVIAWKRNGCCSASSSCMFLPNSTQNEGRNAAWHHTFVRWPGTVFTYYVFLDGDMSLTFRPERSSLPAVDGVGSQELPFRMFEQHLLHYSPAVGFPYYSRWHHDNGEEVQFVSNYDHIMIAIHHNVSRFFLPTETRFDDTSWWYGQRIHGFLAAVAFGNQTLQLNAVVTDNGSQGKRLAQLNGSKSHACAAESSEDFSCHALDFEVAAASNPCACALRCIECISLNTLADMKDNNFEVPFLWFLSSVHPEISGSLLFNFSSPINIDLLSSHALRSAKDQMKTDGVFHLAQGGRSLHLPSVFDIYHPYWLHRKLFFQDRKGVAAFVSACQIYSDFGYIDPLRCVDSSSERRLSNDLMVQFMRPLAQSVRQQHHNIFQQQAQIINQQIQISNQQVQIDNQQLVIDRLLDAVRLLNATVARLDEYSHNV
jgi:hypothetical protein